MNISRTVLLSSLLILSACGGDSSDSDLNDSPNRLGGRWSGALTKVADTCLTSQQQTINFSDSVLQNGGSIQLTQQGGREFLGNAVGDNGFSVDLGSQVAVGGTACARAERIEYDNVNDNNDNTADVDYSIQQTCSNAAECTVTYSGTASRGGASPDPQPTTIPGLPTPPPGVGTPTSKSGCSAMNPNTAAGTYGGSGGCGISDVGFAFTDGTKTSISLRPFGANGSTTFVVDPTNTSVARSTSSALTINGRGNNSCSMTCSPPGTFTVTCLGESGSSCMEKF